MMRFLSATSMAVVVLLVPCAVTAEEKKFTGLLGDETVKVIKDLDEKGWTLTELTGKVEGAAIRFDMTWVDNKIGAWAYWSGLTTKAFQAKDVELKKDGYKLVQQSSWMEGGQERKAGVWHYAPDGRTYSARKNGAFEQTKGRRWEEFTRGNNTYHFVEKNRTNRFVELFDQSRNTTVRLFADRCMIKGGGANDQFELLYTGKWGSK